MKIKAAVCYEYKAPLVIEELDLADPGIEEVQIKLVSTGICHTDITAQENGWGGWNPMPMVFGHEGAGIIEKVGPGVIDFQPGDHVVISYPYCGKCEACLTGRQYFCAEGTRLMHFGTMLNGPSPLSKDGKNINNFFGNSSFATHSVVSIRNIVKVDSALDLTMLAPLACGLMTGSGAVLNQLKPLSGSSIAVFGLGGVGLSAIMGAKIANCKTIIAVDVVESRLQMALEIGATHTINAKEIKDVPAEIMKITGTGANFAVETTGVEAVVKNSIDCLGMDGNVALIAVPAHVEFDQFFFSMHGKKISTIIMGQTQTKLFVPKMIEWYKQGLFPFDKIIKYYAFEDINQAIADSKKGTAIKPVIKF